LYKYEVVRKIVHGFSKLSLAAKTQWGPRDLDAALVLAASRATQ
jgi:hypothetical protein